jgi:glycine cleavage system protein P-like pyridoxal-binding family
VAEGITEQDIRGMFDDDPQTAADTIRRIGAKVYSDRATHNKTVII